MYIMVEDPETGKRLYTDLRIREKVLKRGAFPPTEIMDIEVMDACTENDLASSITASLRGINIQNAVLLRHVLMENFRIFHISNELLEAIQAKMEEVGCVVE